MSRTDLIATGAIYETEELRRLIIENPGLPLVVFAGEEANIGSEYSYMLCSSVSASVGEFLDNEIVFEAEQCFFERCELETYLYENTEFDGPDEEFDAYIADKMKELERYWKKAIIVYVNN